MKFYKYILPLGLMAMTMASCSDTVDDEIRFTPTTATSEMIAPGAQVDRLLVHDLNITYTHPVKIVNPAGITLNGTPVQGATANICNLNIPLALEDGTDYTLEVAPGALVRFDHPEMEADPYTLTFSTTPTPVLKRELCDPNATPEARALFAMLQGIYGEKTLSGCMGDVAWGHGNYDYITSIAGKAPAVIGFDYIHLAASPANWIDYGDITPVKDAWDAGCIPAFTWHWNVPKLNNKKATLSYGLSRFSAANAIVPGNWEYDIVQADLAKLAGYLRLLQDAHIPVLWRPFHEAAGDYSWGAWFWWGGDGPQATKDLWNYVQDQLMNVYGIHNLIYVWTVQTSDAGNLADLSKLQDAYVGDDRCDIVGPDLYKDDELFSDFDTFYLVRQLVRGEKMVALAECGKLHNPDVAMAKGETWLYYMAWYEQANGAFSTGKYSPADVWQTSVNSPCVLNRDDVKALRQ